MTADSRPDLIPLARPPIFTLSAFGDEVAADNGDRLDVLAAEDIHVIWKLLRRLGHDVLDLDPRALAHAAGLLRARGLARLRRCCPVADVAHPPPRPCACFASTARCAAAAALNVLFSWHLLFYVRRATARPPSAPPSLTASAPDRVAPPAPGMTLLLEREVRASTEARLTHFSRPAQAVFASSALRFRLRFQRDSSQSGVRPMAEAWPLLAATLPTSTHVKDAVFATVPSAPPARATARSPPYSRRWRHAATRAS